MNSTELLEAFRDEMADTVTPYLWSDAAIYRYMNDAQEMFCRKTEGIEDSRTVGVTELTIVPGTEWYTLSRKILKVRAATDATTGADVPIYTAEKASTHGVVFNGRTGPVRALIAGLERSALRTWPVPSVAATITLSVFRLPLTPITDDGDQEFEIDPQHHLALLHWMKHKAYDKQDAETFNKRKSDEFEKKFLDYCKAARVEQERARRDVSTVRYGGI